VNAELHNNVLQRKTHMAISDFLLELKSPDVKGESQDDQYPGSIELDSWSWSGSNSSSHAHGSGGGSGKVTHGGISCQKRHCKASAVLFTKLNEGEHFGEAILHCRKKTGNDGKPLEYIKISMKKVTVSNLHVGGHGSADVSDSFNLDYEEIKWEYTEQTPDGKKGAVVQHGWNLAKNKKVG
jgi:type VI secretion system secreted protein Hcp